MAKATHAQEVSTGTSESFTEHEMSDPEPHLALLRNRPTLRDEPVKPAPALAVLPVVPPEEVEETETELEEFEAELEAEPDELEEEEPEAKPAPRKVAKRATSRKRQPASADDEDDFE